MSAFQIRWYRKKGLKSHNIFGPKASQVHVQRKSREKAPCFLDREKSSKGLLAYSNNHVFLRESCSSPVPASRASLGMWPWYLRTRNFLLLRLSPSISSMHSGPEILEGMTVNWSQRRKAPSQAWKGTQQVWWESQNETQKDPEETTLYWEAGEVSWSRPGNLSAAFEKYRSGKRRLE